MPEYEFRPVDGGKIVSRVMTMAEAPSVGDVIDIDGVKHVRLRERLSTPAVQNYAHTSVTLPRNCVHAPRHDKHGRCVFESKAEIDNTVAKMNADPSFGGTQYNWEK